MRVRAKYEKGDAVRFLGHLDVARVIQIAVRRAYWPVEMSQGFNPRPRLSFYAPLPAGTAGLEEYFDATLSSWRSLPELAKSLSGSLPQGMRLHEVYGVADKEEPLEAQIAASEYSVDLWGIDVSLLNRALEAFMELDEAPYLVVRPKEEKSVDLRPFVLAVGEARPGSGERVLFDMTISHESGRTIRPQWVLASLSRFGMDVDPREAIIDRRKILIGKPEK